MSDHEMENRKENEGKVSKFANETFDWVQCIVAALVVTILVFTFVGRIIGVDGSSMYPTLLDGEKMVMSNLFYEPKQGDIVVLTQKSFRNEPIVKRIIATEGQIVDIRDGNVYVDDAKLDEEYLMDGVPTYEQDIDFPVTVSEGCVLVMGDNRTRSTDSRSSLVGQIDERCILGRVYAVVLPLNKIGAVH